MFEVSSHMPSAAVARRDLSLGFASLPPIDVKKIWSVLWRGKITILLSTMVAVALAVVFVLLTPHKYTATTQILIDPMDLRGSAERHHRRPFSKATPPCSRSRARRA